MNTMIGIFAACCTTISYVPQIRKCWQTGSAEDLSLGMLLILILGIGTWVLYGFLQHDSVIAGANSISLALLFTILYFKLRMQRRARSASRAMPQKGDAGRQTS